MSTPTLETLMEAIEVARTQADQLRLVYKDHTSGTGYTVDAVERKLGHLYEDVSDEVDALLKAGDL